MAYWIWFPHDFSIDLRGRVEMRRQEHGMTCPSIWRMDAPSRAVAFRRAYTLDAPGRARLFSQGEAYVCWRARASRRSARPSRTARRRSPCPRAATCSRSR